MEISWQGGGMWNLWGEFVEFVRGICAGEFEICRGPLWDLQENFCGICGKNFCGIYGKNFCGICGKIFVIFVGYKEMPGLRMRIKKTYPLIFRKNALEHVLDMSFYTIACFMRFCN